MNDVFRIVEIVLNVIEFEVMLHIMISRYEYKYELMRILIGKDNKIFLIRMDFYYINNENTNAYPQIFSYVMETS